MTNEPVCDCPRCELFRETSPPAPAPDPMPSILDPLRNLLRRVARWGR